MAPVLAFKAITYLQPKEETPGKPSGFTLKPQLEWWVRVSLDVFFAAQTPSIIE